MDRLGFKPWLEHFFVFLGRIFFCLIGPPVTFITLITDWILLVFTSLIHLKNHDSRTPIGLANIQVLLSKHMDSGFTVQTQVQYLSLITKKVIIKGSAVKCSALKYTAFLDNIILFILLRVGKSKSLNGLFYTRDKSFETGKTSSAKKAVSALDDQVWMSPVFVRPVGHLVRNCPRRWLFRTGKLSKSNLNLHQTNK